MSYVMPTIVPNWQWYPKYPVFHPVFPYAPPAPPHCSSCGRCPSCGKPFITAAITWSNT